LRGENAPESEEPDAAENAYTSSKEDSSDSVESEKPEEE
jgi:hypothetical protein